MSNPFRDWYVFFNLIKETIMAKIDMLKERGDRYRRWFSFLLNVILAIVIGISGVIYGFMNEEISQKIGIISFLSLLIFLIKVVIIILINYEKMIILEKELEEA